MGNFDVKSVMPFQKMQWNLSQVSHQWLAQGIGKQNSLKIRLLITDFSAEIVNSIYEYLEEVYFGDFIDIFRSAFYWHI